MYSGPRGGYAPAMKETREQGRALVVVAVVVTAGAGAAAAWYFAGGAKRFGPAGPVRTLVPGDAAVYVEMRDAASLWDSVASSEAAADFAMSHTRRRFMALPAVSDARALLDEITTQAKYELNDANLKKLFGREVAVGIVPRTDAQAPDWVLVSKLDLAALAKDLLTGDADFTKLHDVIDARTGLCEFAVSRTEHRGVAVSRATKGDAAFSFTLVGDALVVAGDAALVTRSIDSYLDDGRGSIAKVPAFAADTAKVPATAPIVEWYDLDRMRATRASVTAGIDALGGGGAENGAAAAVDHVLDGASDIRTIARATELPGGNAYEMKWTWSPAAGAAATPQAPLAATLLPDAPMYIEVRGVAQLMASWDRSALARKLGSGYLGKQFDEFVARPDTISRGLGGGRLLTGIAGLEELDRAGQDDDADAEAKDSTEWQPHPPSFGAFEAKTVLRVARRFTEELAGSSVGIAIAPARDRGASEIAVATRVAHGTDLLLLVAESTALLGGSAKSERHGAHRILVFNTPDPGRGGSAVAHAAGHVIAASSADGVRRAIDGLTALGAPAQTTRTTALAGTDAAHFVMHARVAALKELGASPESALSLFGPTPEDAVFAARVEGDFESLRFSGRGTRAPGAPDVTVPGRAVPSCRSTLPADPIAHACCAVDLTAAWRLITSLMDPEDASAEDVAAWFGDAAGVELVTDLLPALGPEIALSIHRSAPADAAPPNGGGPPSPATPGFVVAIEMQRPEVVRKAIDGLLATVQAEADAAADEIGAERTPIHTRSRLNSADLLCLDGLSDDGTPTPALAFHGAFLLIASDESLVRASIDTAKPGARSLAANASMERALAGVAPGSATGFLDWNAFLDQMAEYAPVFAQYLPDEEPTDGDDAVPEPPEYPENPRDRKAVEAWQKRMQQYQETLAARGAVRVRTWLDAARVIDVIGMSSRTEGAVEHVDLLIRFAK